MKIAQLGFNATIFSTASWGKQIKEEVACLGDLYLLSGTPESGHMYMELNMSNGETHDIGIYTLNGRLSDFDGVRDIHPTIIEHLEQTMKIDCSVLKKEKVE